MHSIFSRKLETIKYQESIDTFKGDFPHSLFNNSIYDGKIEK